MEIKAGIIGAAGYTAGELIRILVNHPKVDITFAQSNSQVGKNVNEIHQGLIGETDLTFCSANDMKEADIVFLCKGHGESLKVIESKPDLLQKRIVDLSHDFRLQGDHDFVYGLPEMNKEAIGSAKHVANPGCFATSIQLAILPVIQKNFVRGNIHVSGITGSTGAGQSFSATSHFSWRNNNASVYKPFVHQHLKEIGESITSQNEKWDGQINFIPYRGAFARGIITTSYFETDKNESELKLLYEQAYEDHPFVHVIGENPDLKMVVNTNKAVIYPAVVGSQGMIISVIDNLLKGASGQAVQNMNLLFHLDEKTGLNFKSSAF